MIIYEATQNSDLTEGRGSQIGIGYFLDEADAVEAVKGRGVMGVGDGEVYSIVVHDSVEAWKRDINGAYDYPRREKVYGHRKDWREKWGYGYVDNRDAPVADPEYVEFVRLRKKFENL